ncbi:hypothetical protein V5799_009696 [Amblyomma americanum]|uniref:Uncharacterized protein n=1 Tax=Amblyomma americanum TaxID=6943 RepID=A0AAQ4F9N5_AMBAM
MSLYAGQRDTSGTPKTATLDSSGTCLSLLEGQGDSQRHHRHNHLHLQDTIPKAQTGRFEVVVMTAVGKSHQGHRRENSRSHKRGHRSEHKDNRKSSKSSSGRKHGGSRGKGEHRSHRKSRSSKRKRDKGGKRETKHVEGPVSSAESTSDLSGRPFRTFDFGISSIPVTRGTLPRPELTRASECELASSTWLALPDDRASVEVRPPTSKSSLQQTSAPSRTDEKRETYKASYIPAGRQPALQRQIKPKDGTLPSHRGTTEIQAASKGSAPDLRSGKSEGSGSSSMSKAVEKSQYARPEPTRASDRKPLTKITLTHPTTTPEHRTTPEEDTQQPPTVVPTSKPAEAYYCSTDYCKREASYVKGLLSRESRPCDDFYRHVCDVWMSEHPADRRTRSLVSQDTLLQDALTHQLLDVVRSADEQDIKVAADLNDACTDTTHTALASKEAIDALFSQWKIEKWPRTDEVKDETVWTFAAELSRDLDVATIVQPSVGIDPENLVAIVIELAKPRCLCTDTNEESKNAHEVFREAVREAGTLLGASFTDEFEDRLLAACTSIAAVCHATYEDDRVVVVRFRQLTVELRVFLTVLTGGRIQEVDNVVLRSAPDFPRKLGDALQAVPPLDALNYFGFLALVRMAPFLPGDLHSLRDLFAEKLLGHTVGNSEDNTLLCARLVESVLPGCFAKAAQIWRHSTGQELPTRDWLSQLETVFLGHLLDFPWISELSSLFIRYRVKRIAFTQLGPSASYKQEACAPPNAPRADSAVQFFADISRNQQARKLQMLHSDGTLLSQEAAGSEFSTQASLRRPLQVIHVPAALFNVSVPINSSSFVFHLARVAVRFYRALVQFLHEDPYERDISMSFTEESRRRLSVLLSCFDEDAKYTLAAMAASPTSEAVASVRRDFLDRTSALILATKAFEELLPIRRIWKLDLRLAGLEELSAMQLFFIYFALDNCESADPSLHRTSMFPQYKVNVPLRHIQEFAKAFGCSAQDHMVSEVYGCYTMVHRGRQRRISTPTQDQQARGQYFSSTTPVHQGN